MALSLFCAKHLVIIDKAVTGISRESLGRFLLRARRAVGVSGKVNILVASSRRVRGLNRRFRGKDKPTDVLSFPPLLPVSRDFAGDIAISADVAVRNAIRYGHAPAEEVKILVLHGLLHLAGYDHETDRGRMARREEHLRTILGLPGGLIRRALDASPAARRKS